MTFDDAAIVTGFGLALVGLLGVVVGIAARATPIGDCVFSHLADAPKARTAVRRGELHSLLSWFAAAKATPNPQDELAARIAAAAYWDAGGKTSAALLAAQPENEIAVALRIDVLIRLAWKERGWGKGSELSERRYLRFTDLIVEARDLAEASQDRIRHFPLLHAIHIATICDAEATEREATDKSFRAAVAESPQHWLAHHLRLVSLSPKWYGKDDEMEKFVQERTAGLPAGHILHGLHPHLVLERSLYLLYWGGGYREANAYMRHPARLSQLHELLEAMLAQPETRVHPNFPAVLMMFAACGKQSGDSKLSRRALKALGPHPMWYRWLLVVDPKYIKDMRNGLLMAPLRFAKVRMTP